MNASQRKHLAEEGPLDLLITDGRVATATSIEQVSIGVRGERIVFLSSSSPPVHKRRVSAKGLLVLPGLIDPHVHLGLPMAGTITSDSPTSGTQAAVHGGVTTIIDFTLQRKGQTLPESLAQRRSEFEGCAHTDFAFHANVTWFGNDFAERLSADLPELVRRGCRSLKVFTCYSEIGYTIGDDDLHTLLQESHRHGLQVLVHAEADTVVAEATARLLNVGRSMPQDYPQSRPPEAEVEAIRRVIDIAARVEVPIYFVHVSTAAGAQTIREARSRRGNPPVYLETCPQYLWLDETRFAGADGSFFLVAPPLRSAADRDRLRQLLLDSTVDVVATDHCCFRQAQKALLNKPFSELPKGLPGIETRLPLVHTLFRTYAPQALPQMMNLLARNPARIMGLDPKKGSIMVGADADLVWFDPDARWTVEAAGLHTATDFSPYEGETVYGRVHSVFLRGKQILCEGELIGPPTGHYVERVAP